MTTGRAAATHRQRGERESVAAVVRIATVPSAMERAMAQSLSGKKIAILATDGFEQAELQEPLKALRNEGAQVDIVAPHGGEIQGMRHHDKGETMKVDRTLDEA